MTIEPVDQVPEPALRGWHRPVGWVPLLVVSLLVLLLWLALMAASVWWLRGHWQALATLRHLPLVLNLPQGIVGQADVHSRLVTRLDMNPAVALPINQVVSVQLLDTLQARTTVRTEVPVSTQVDFQADIPVVTEVEAEVPVVSWLPSMAVKLPVQFTVPIKVSVPVRATLPLALDLAVSAQVPEPLAVPLKTVIHTRVPLHARLEATVTRQTEFRLDQAILSMPMVIERTPMRVPFKDVSWHLRPAIVVPARP